MQNRATTFLAIILGIAMLIAVCYGFWNLPESNLPFRIEQPRIDTTHDPKLGTKVPELFCSNVDAVGKRIVSGSKDLIIYGGVCTSCALDSVKFELLPIAEFDRIFVFYESRAADLKSIITKEPPKNVFLLAEPTGTVRVHLNANTIGRWYSFKNGILVDVQKELEDRSW